jgi:small conductance mechanosensitive channel
VQRHSLFRRPLWAALVAVCLLASDPAFAAPPEPPVQPITLEVGPRTDRAIEARLRKIYAQLDSLQAVEVEVDAGVVHLGGQVRSLEAAQDAETIAERVERVAAVTNDIQLEAEVGRRLQPVFERMRELVSGWLSYLPLVLIAIVAVMLAWFLARLLAWRSRRHSERSSLARVIVEQLMRAGILAAGIAIALEVIGARGLLGAMIGTAGVIGVVIGIASKNIGEAYFASVLLSMRRPFDPQDYVRIEDVEGLVVRLTSRATILMTLEGTLVSIPNSKVFNATVINFSRNPQRRFAFKLGVGWDAELRSVQELVVTTLAAVPGVLAEPGPECLIDGFGEGSVVISVGGWIDQRSSDWFKVSSEAKRRIKAAFEQAGIDVPEPVLRVRTTTYQPRAAILEPRTEPSPDVSPDQHLHRQVAEERMVGLQNDLMREGRRTE